MHADLSSAANPVVSWSLVRILAVLVAISMLTPLVIATRLEPNPVGLGTHQQLGLPPCTMRIVFELRCPACGMTTSWAHFVRGEWFSSAGVNLGGFLLALYAIAAVFVCGRIAWTGLLPGIAAQNWATLGLLVIAIVTMLDWAARLIAGRLL